MHWLRLIVTEYEYETGKQPVPNASTESEPGRGCSRMLGTRNFLDFLGKNLVPGKWHSGMQTSNLNLKLPTNVTNFKV